MLYKGQLTYWVGSQHRRLLGERLLPWRHREGAMHEVLVVAMDVMLVGRYHPVGLPSVHWAVQPLMAHILLRL